MKLIAEGISSKLNESEKDLVRNNIGFYDRAVLRISTVATLKATAGLFNSQLAAVAEYSVGTGVGGCIATWDSTSTVSANDVTVFQVTGVPTGRWIVNWSVLTPEMAGMVGDNTTNNDAALARLISFAKIDNTPIDWGRRRYLTGPANGVDFHSCKHAGTATLNRNGTLWHITPQGSQENVLYVAQSGNVANDGMTPSTPVPISRAIEILKSYSDKAQDGFWRVQFAAETVTFNGIRLSDMPMFRNKLRIWGADVALTAVPTTIWDGTTSSTAYALRQDGGVAAVANWHFKNIKFINWMYGGANNGAILIWAQGNTLCENIHCDNMGTGIWGRHGYFRITHGRIENVDTYGVGIQYGASGNVGNLSGGGVFIRGRVGGEAVGIAIGRNTTTYIQGCDIDHTNAHINVTRLSRIRTQANTFGANYGVCCVWNDTNSVWTPDNGSGYPDIYPTLTELKPAYRCEMGSVHQKIDRLAQRSVHAVSEGVLLTITDVNKNQLSSLPSGSTFTPFRLPKWFLYSPFFRLDVEIGIALADGAGGVLALHGQSDAATSQLAVITIPNVAVYTKGIIRMSVIQSSGVSNARYSVEFRAANILEEMVNTPSLNTSGLRSPFEDDLVYRLYWTSNNANRVDLFSMRTYVES